MFAAAAGFPDPPGRLLAVCQALQKAAGQCGAKYFLLSCRTAAAVCGFQGGNGYVTANRWLNRFVERGLLVLVERGAVGITSRKASCYRIR